MYCCMNVLVTTAQRWGASPLRTVDNSILRERRQCANSYNKPLLTWATKQEGKGPTSWTSYIEGVDWKTQLHIKTPGDITLTTSCVSCEQPTTMLYRFATTSCPSDCSWRRRRRVWRLTHLCCVHQFVTCTSGTYLLIMTHFNYDDIPPV
jgi:hypothetical protein